MLQPLLVRDQCSETDLSIFLNDVNQSYDAYLDLALLERVPINPESIALKIFIGRLYNYGIKLCEIRKHFRHDNRTIKKWGEALRSGDVDEMLESFRGRNYRKKLSPEIIRYIRQQYINRQKLNLGANYRQKITWMVKEIFGIDLCPSLMSSIFKDIQPLSEEFCILEGYSKVEKLSTREQQEDDLSLKKEVPVDESPTFPVLNEVSVREGEKYFLQHAGLMLFAFCMKLFTGFERQIVCQLLQGAVNIEQSKSLCHESLNLFCMKTITQLSEQREALHEAANFENVRALYQRNSTLLPDGPNKGSVFYFDPHTKEYTGALKVLKGWCGRRHKVSKVMNLDCFHSRSGRPCFIGHYSSYYDMRERFFMSLFQFDRLFEEDKRQGRTFVIDRGIFGLETFARFKKDYLITWEKNYKKGAWNEKLPLESFTKIRYRNNSKDIKTYHFECQEQVWKKNRSFRRIIVKATNPSSNCIEVSVLCNNPKMKLQEIVWAIFSRWIQENDFKTLDVHYGINQLDSRASLSIARQKYSLKDQDIDCPEFIELKQQIKACDDKLARALLKKHKKANELQKMEVEITRQCTKAERAIEVIIAAIQKNKLNRKCFDNLRQFHKILDKLIKDRNNKTLACQKLQGEVQVLEEVSEKLKLQICDVIRKGSRLNLLIKQNYRTLDTRKKMYMDALRIIAANQFRLLIDEFRPEYKNFRDDHFILRMLTRSDGIIVKHQNQYKLKLWIAGSTQNYIQKAIHRLFDKISLKIKMETGIHVKIELISGPIRFKNIA